MFVLRDEVWVMRGDGSRARLVRAFVRKRLPGGKIVYPPRSVRGGRLEVESLDISADGSRLLVSRYSVLETMRVDGGGRRLLKAIGAKPQGYEGSDCCGPQFSPRGDRVIGHFVAEEGEGMGTMPTGGGRVRMLTFYGYSASYSDDGGRIVFVNDGIWTMRADGTGARRAFSVPGGIVSNPDFSPDGRSVTFSYTDVGKLIVIGEDRTYTYVARLNGSRTRRIGSGIAGFNYENPQWIR